MKRVVILLIVFCLILIGCAKEKEMYKADEWEESAKLVREVVVTDAGDKGNFVFRIGNNGKLGFGEYGPFIKNQTQKYMWFFWGRRTS